MKIKLLFVFIMLVAFFGETSAKDTVCITIRPSTITGAIISTQDSNAQGGPSNLFYSATWTCGPPCLDRGLIKFDLSAIPNNAIITNATLSLYADNSSSVGMPGQPTYGSDNAGWLQRVTSAWSPNTVTWNTQPSATVIDEATLGQSINTTENYVVSVTQLVKDIVSSGNNYGFELLQHDENTPYQSLIFGSSTNTDSNLRPQLQICYVTNVVSSDTCISLRPYDTTGAIISTQDSSAQGGPSNLFYSATWTCGPPCLDRGLIKFDLSAIPNNATISNATLSLYADNSASIGMSGQPTYGSDNAGWLQRVTSAWSPNTVTWNTKPTTTITDEATLVQSINTSENYVINVTQLIKDIISNGNNYGFELLQHDESTPYQSLIFGSSINKDTTVHPKLDICYSLPNTTSVIPAYNPNIVIEVYPNPARDEVVFKTSSNESVKEYHVEMYNVLGQLVRGFQLYPYMVTINTSDLPRGIYLYKIVDNTSVLQNGKIILQ